LWEENAVVGVAHVGAGTRSASGSATIFEIAIDV